MKVSVGDFEINCEVEGVEGAPWITFSHALGNNLTLWDDQVALLKDRFRYPALRSSRSWRIGRTSRPLLLR